jgi:hypothetical protein
MRGVTNVPSLLKKRYECMMQTFVQKNIRVTMV